MTHFTPQAHEVKGTSSLHSPKNYCNYCTKYPSFFLSQQSHNEPRHTFKVIKMSTMLMVVLARRPFPENKFEQVER